ncbi:universal stress protein [Sulfitobacter sp. S190]|nr:universal stress protein [Sulfitobacter sp. S190]
MTRRTILYVMDANTPDAQITDAAVAAAQDQTHLICLILAQAPALPMYAYGVPPYGGVNIPDNWPELISGAQQKQKTRINAVETVLAKSNASGEVVSALCVSRDIKHHVARVARVSDEAFIAPNLRETPVFLHEVAAGVLFHAPVGLRINGTLSQVNKRIMIAWDSSKAASAAAHAALPHLKSATDVLIACIDPVMTPDRDGEEPGADIAAWLSHHGCNVTVAQYPGGGREVEQCIQDRAHEFGADLVVMGAYGHSRMIQTVLGGTTRSLMDQTETPVLFAH